MLDRHRPSCDRITPAEKETVTFLALLKRGSCAWEILQKRSLSTGIKRKERKKLLDFGKLSTLALCNSLDEAWEWGVGHFSTAGFGAD